MPGDDVRRKRDRKSTRLNSSHVKIWYAVFCLKQQKRALRAGGLGDDALAVGGRLRRALRGGLKPARSCGFSMPQVDQTQQRLIFFCYDTTTSDTYTLSLHIALPI